MVRICVLLLFMSMLASCASTKMLNRQAEYERELNRLVKAPLNLEEKMDGVAAVLNEVLQESLDYNRAKHTLRHITQFQKRNKATMNVLLQQMEAERRKMNPGQQIAFSVSILRKPYIKSFLTIVPKVEKKINRKLKQVAMFGRFLKILNPF
ncbi:hypothetical protein [Portibacter marinus]|uniref:hypothetical protein n=1 Tax=Portibacter marinus TaxID=2898660 RepID=UPI001F2776B4|nr:hypothetical protein [Portibacter marinus]